MNNFYTQEELDKIELKSIGLNVKISRKVSIYSPQNIEIGENVRIDDFCILSGKIRIGNNIHIAAYSAIYGGNEGVYIDDFVNISSRVSIYSVSDDYSGLTMTSPVIPDECKNVTSKKVSICKHVIIGSTSVVLPGVTLNEGSAFGCFSLIKNDSLSWSINTGIPSKKIKNRERNILQLEKEYLNKVK